MAHSDNVLNAAGGTLPIRTGNDGTNSFPCISGVDSGKVERLILTEVSSAVDVPGAQIVKAGGTGILIAGGGGTAITAGVYAAGQALGTLWTFAAATRLAAGTGKIKSATVTDKAKQSAALDLLFFNAAPTAPTDNATFAPSTADLAKLVGILSIPSSAWSNFSANGAVCVTDPGVMFNLAAGTTLNVIVVVRNAPTFASTSDLAITLGIDQD